MLNSSRFALGLLLPLTLAACSAPSTPSTPVAFYGDGLDHSWTANAKEGQQLYQSLSNGLKTQGVDMGVTLDITASNGWGPIEVNTSNGETAAGDGKTITMKGKTYATGLGVHGDSEIHIKATGLVTPACTRFKADIGIDDEVGANGKFSSVVFQVFADGEKLYDSGLVTGSTPMKSIDIPVGNKSDLRFVVTHGPDLNYYDHADWAGASLTCSNTPTGPSGSLDPSFDGDGLVVTRFDETAGFNSTAAAFAQLPDGRLVVAGTQFGENVDATTLLVRYNVDGSLDSTFGTGGKSVSNLIPRNPSAPLGSETSYGVTLLPDGKYLLASAAESGDSIVPIPMLARFNQDGTLDTTFGVGGKVEVTNFVNGVAVDIILLPDGRFLVNGIRGVQRYTANGILDTSFGTGGTVAFSDQYSVGVDTIARQSDGRILVLKTGGYLERYTENGQLDTSFGTGGTIAYEAIRASYPTNPGSSPNFTGFTVLVLPDDRFLVALVGRKFGSSTPTGGLPGPTVQSASILVRHNPDGSFDTSFGQDGKVVYTEGYGFNNLRLLSDGKLLSYPFRYNSNGTPDFTYTPPRKDIGFLGVQADNKILLGGATLRYPDAPITLSSPTDFTVARVLP